MFKARFASAKPLGSKQGRNLGSKKFGSLKLGALAAIAAGTLVISGCSAPAEDSNSAAGNQTVTVWHYFSDDNQVKILDDYKASFEAANEGVTVENVYVPYDQMVPSLLTAASSGEGPDAVVFNGGDASTLAIGGALAPLTEQWASYPDAGQYADALLRSVDGTLYATQGYVNLLGLWYNADILDAVGVKPPTSISELNTALTAVVDAGYQGITMTGVPNGQSEWQAYPWLTAFGWDYANPQRQPLVDAFTQAQAWVTSGVLSAEVVTWDQTVPFQVFAAGDVAFAENGNWQRGTAQSTASFNYGVVPLPVGNTGGVYLGGEGLGIGAFAKNPDLAWRYLQETYLSVEGQLLALNTVGSIPARADAAQTDAVTSDPLIAAFAETIAKYGNAYPNAVVPADVASDLGLDVGAVWSSVLARQLTPEEAADQVMEIVNRLW